MNSTTLVAPGRASAKSSPTASKPPEIERGLAVRRHLVDSRVDHGRVVRPWHARRRDRREGHHREARRVRPEGEHVHQVLGEGLQPVGPFHRADGSGLLHRAALVEHQNEVNQQRPARGVGGGSHEAVLLNREDGFVLGHARGDLVRGPCAGE
eukprot:scaffold66468_cov62-Phaeocystis_antarctica.AAC.1